MKTRILKPTDYNISRAADIIQKGGLVAFPTETVYGLGANVFDPNAVAKIFAVKKRPAFDPLIVHTSNIRQILKLTDNIPDKAKIVMKTFWPGPLTIVLKKRQFVPQIVTGGLDSVAVRIPNNKIALKLIKKSGTAIAAPSANPFGYLSPTNAMHVKKMLNGKVDVILDGGTTRIGIESTIIAFSQNNAYLLRSGGLPIEKLNKAIGKIHKAPKHKKMISPGRMKKHYSPVTRVKIFNRMNRPKTNGRYALVLYSKQALKFAWISQFAKQASYIRYLSIRGNLIEAASAFFEILHELDGYSLDTIYIQKAPAESLGMAINERITKMNV